MKLTVSFMKRIALILATSMLPTLAMAAYQVRGTGAGKVADNLMEPVSILANFIGSMSIVIGISFLLASFLKYMQYRVNPLVAPISTVITLFIMGIVLLCIPLAYKLTEGGIPINL
jgi:FtsH-binding integral membrane protein